MSITNKCPERNHIIPIKSFKDLLIVKVTNKEQFSKKTLHRPLVVIEKMEKLLKI